MRYDIPKGKMFQSMERIHAATIEAPVKIGDVLLPDLFGPDIAATKEIP